MKKTKKNNEVTQGHNPYHICYDHYMDTNSCTECTGLAYRPATDSEEWDSYLDIFDFTPESEEFVRK